jgi:hypothetical protein
MIKHSFTDFLLIVGIALIIAAGIFCVVQLIDADFDNYGYSKYGSLMNDANKAYILSAVITTVSIFLVGLFFIALSKIIELLENLQNPQRATTSSQNLTVKNSN